jgi:hypothetical protein
MLTLEIRFSGEVQTNTHWLVLFKSVLTLRLCDLLDMLESPLTNSNLLTLVEVILVHLLH